MQLHVDDDVTQYPALLLHLLTPELQSQHLICVFCPERALTAL